MSSREKTIMRAGYKRHGYHRSPYVRRDGTRVAGSYVRGTYVPKAKITARGRATVTGHKGKKLIPMKDYRHLRNYNYSFKSESTKRHSALNKASSDQGHRWVIRRLNALHTLYRNTEPMLSRKAGNDLKYVEKQYKKYKKAHRRY